MGVLFGVGGGYSTLVGLFGDEIKLVSGEGDDNVLVGLTLKLLDPSLCLVEGCLYGRVNRALRTESVRGIVQLE